MTTFNTAMGWLNQFEVQSSFLSISVRQMVNGLQEALRERNFARAHVLIDGVLQVSRSNTVEDDGMEYAEVHLTCARAYFVMGDMRRAKLQIQQAMSLYNGRQHNQAVAQWLLGCVLWELPTDVNDAIIYWQRSYNNFIRLASESSRGSEAAEWYQDLCNELQQAIIEALETV